MVAEEHFHCRPYGFGVLRRFTVADDIAVLLGEQLGMGLRIHSLSCGEPSANVPLSAAGRGSGRPVLGKS